VSRIFLEGGKSASFPFIRSSGQSNRNSKGSEKDWKFWRGGGVNDFGIRRAWGYSILEFPKARWV